MKKNTKSHLSSNCENRILGEKLRTIRLSLDLTQAQLLSFIRPDIDSDRLRAFVSQWESGRREPARRWLIRYADIASINLDTLIRDDRKLPGRIINAAEANYPKGKSQLRSNNSSKLLSSEGQNDVAGESAVAKDRKARTIAVYSNERESGKTVTAAHLSLRSVIVGQKVLLIDTTIDDAGGQTTSYFSCHRLDRKKSETSKSFYDFLVGNQKDTILELRENLHLIRGGFDLHRLDEKLAGSKEIYEKAFKGLFNSFDLIIFDLSSEWNIRNKHTLRFVDEIIVPFNLSGSVATTLSTLFDKQFASIHPHENKKAVERVEKGDRSNNQAETLFKQIYILPNRLDDRRTDPDHCLNNFNNIFNHLVFADQGESYFKYGNIKICKRIPYSYKLQNNYCQNKSVNWYQDNKLIAETYQALLDEIQITNA